MVFCVVFAAAGTVAQNVAPGTGDEIEEIGDVEEIEEIGEVECRRRNRLPCGPGPADQ